MITLQLNNHALIIPPGADDFRVEVQGTLPNDATLLSFFPHMHLRGKRFEYDIVHDDGSVEVLLRVNYHFHWQLSYKLAEPRPLKAGTKSASDRLVRQLKKQPPQSRSREDRDVGRSNLRRNDGGLLRRSRAGSRRQVALLHPPEITMIMWGQPPPAVRSSEARCVLRR